MLSYVKFTCSVLFDSLCGVERNKPRDQLVVTLFLLTVFGLLLAAGIKNRMLKAGLTPSLPWNTRRRWWEVSRQYNPDREPWR